MGSGALHLKLCILCEREKAASTHAEQMRCTHCNVADSALVSGEHRHCTTWHMHTVCHSLGIQPTVYTRMSQKTLDSALALLEEINGCPVQRKAQILPSAAAVGLILGENEIKDSWPANPPYLSACLSSDMSHWLWIRIWYWYTDGSSLYFTFRKNGINVVS